MGFSLERDFLESEFPVEMDGRLQSGVAFDEDAFCPQCLRILQQDHFPCLFNRVQVSNRCRRGRSSGGSSEIKMPNRWFQNGTSPVFSHLITAGGRLGGGLRERRPGRSCGSRRHIVPDVRYRANWRLFGVCPTFQPRGL